MPCNSPRIKASSPSPPPNPVTSFTSRSRALDSRRVSLWAAEPTPALANSAGDERLRKPSMAVIPLCVLTTRMRGSLAALPIHDSVRRSTRMPGRWRSWA